MTEACAAGVKQSGKFILQWHITHACNLRCAHCYQKDYAEQTSDEDLITILEKYDDYLRENDLRGHIFLTGGEPLTHPGFFDLLRAINQRGIPFTVLTNGTLIDKRAARRFAWFRPDCVQISLDGTRSFHDAIRGEGSFQLALDGIDRLVKYNVPVIVSFTAQKSNLRCFRELAEICRQHGVRKLWWDRVVTDDAAAKETLALSTDDFKHMCRLAGRLHKHYKRRTGDFTVSCERSLQFLKCGDAQPYTCHAGKDMLTILPDGSVMPCRRLPFVSGNIHEADFRTILNQSDVQALAQAPIPAACEACKYASRCRGGAKCVTYGQTNELFSRDVNCFLNLRGGKPS